MIRKLIFAMMLLPIFLVAQPSGNNGNSGNKGGTRDQGGGNDKACDQPNPPSWCENATPIDNKLYIGLMILGGVALAAGAIKKGALNKE
ncbi:MAG: hypothetical protein ABFR62_06260 [Bacteroidota bacterium]